jgi:hypothetical protein
VEISGGRLLEVKLGSGAILVMKEDY